MPGKSGIQVLEEIRQLKGNAFTVAAMSSTPWLARDCPFDAGLTKPFTKADLFNTIHTLVPAFKD